MAELFDEEVTETKGFDESSINTVSTHHTTETMEARQFMHLLQLNDDLAFQTIKTCHRTVSMKARQSMHPLQINDELAFKTIKTVKLNFLTNEAKAPIPRCQALPDRAFSKLTGRSISERS